MPLIFPQRLTVAVPAIIQGQLNVQDAQLMAQWSKYFEEAVRKDGALVRDTVRDAIFNYSKQSSSVILEFGDIELHNPDLANYLLKRPAHALRIAAQAMHQVDVPVEPRPKLGIRLRGLRSGEEVVIRDIRSELLGTLHCIDGVIRKATPVKSAIMEAVFECKVCTTRVSVLQEEASLTEPVMCETCEKDRPWRLVEEETRSLNVQRIQLEELTETMDVPAQPQRIQAYITNDDVLNQERLLNAVGSRVRCTVYISTRPPKKAEGKPVEREFMLQVLDLEPLDESQTRIKLSPEDIQDIEDAAKGPRHLENLVASLAPGLKGLEIEKEALLMAMFGGVHKGVGNHQMRGDIHLLFCGDPSVGKSKLLEAGQAIVPRSVFASGEGSSGPGLTAAVVKDDFDGQYTLEPGALPLADNGIAFVDELDKMGEVEQKSMHGALEKQQINIDKAGVHATLKTRCGVIAASNPKKGRFDTYDNMVEQIDLTPALLSRFDIILVMREIVNKEDDTMKVGHIMRMHRLGQLGVLQKLRRAFTTPDAPVEAPPPYHLVFMRKFITYAKAHVFPALTQEAEDVLSGYYLSLRNPNSDQIAVTLRQAEGLIRLSEASARMRLSHEITVHDARRAIGIYQEYMKRCLLDKETGRFDIDIIATGGTKSQHERVQLVQDYVRQNKNTTKMGVPETDIIKHLLGHGITEELTRKTLEQLRRDGMLYCPQRHDHYAPAKG